jgi:hypothetical protein
MENMAMTTRRRFIEIVPAAAAMGALAPLLAACGEKAPAPAAAPTPAPSPAPAPAPVSAAPAPAPAPAPASADALPMLAENNPTAVSLGYVAVASRVDRTRYTQYQPGQQCSNCALYQGAATAPAAACPLFAGHRVAAEGWCSAYARRAG